MKNIRPFFLRGCIKPAKIRVLQQNTPAPINHPRQSAEISMLDTSGF